MLIIATIGPSIVYKPILRDVIEAGVNTLRFNFSHGNFKEFEETLKCAREIKSDIHILQDLSGTKIRVSDKLNYIMKLYNNEEIFFCGEDKYEGRSTSGKVIPLNVSSNLLRNENFKEISMKDNTMRFKVIKIQENFIKVKVLRGGIVRPGKGCNIKGLTREKISLSLKDMEDLRWGIKNGVDFICQSFVEDESNIRDIKNFIKNIGAINTPKILAKIETPLGVKNVKNILKEVDGIVIGRGDLIPEGSLIKTPIYEEAIYNEVIKAGGLIIIGTHLLNSMKVGQNPQLPEVESIYNHIKKGAGGFLLAGETSIGKAPIKTVKFLKSLVDYYSY